MSQFNYFNDVGEFHKKFDLDYYGNGKGPRLLNDETMEFRTKFLEEELEEFRQACNVVEAADALADLVYVALGTAHMMGIPFDDIWAEVQRANMSKVRASSGADPRSTRRNALDVVKPEGFTPPDHFPAIQRAAIKAHNDWADQGKKS